MAGRLKDDVWPVVAKLLDMYMREKRGNLKRNSLVSTDLTNQNKAFLTEREKLLLSILDFLTRVYSERECGLQLSGLIPTVGAILLPFVGEEGQLAAKAMNALRSMLIIDCDALERPLLRLSQRRLLARRIQPQGPLICAEQANVCLSPLERAAEELLDFIDSLPEQSLVD